MDQSQHHFVGKQLFESRLGGKKMIREIVLERKESSQNVTLFVTNNEDITFFQAEINSTKWNVTLPYIYGSKVQIHSYTEKTWN